MAAAGDPAGNKPEGGHHLAIPHLPDTGDFRVVFQRSGSRIDVIDVLSKPHFQKAY